MLESQLLHTLRLLEPEELETLHLFVASPIFQEQHWEDTLRFFEDLKRYYPAFRHANLSKGSVAGRLFKQRTDPDFDVTRAMSDLLRITRHFINFRYSAVHSGRPRPGKDGAGDQMDVVQLLNRVRKQLALLRFYNERLHNRPTPTTDAAKKAIPAAGKKGRHVDNFFGNLYKSLRKELDQVKDFRHFEEHEFHEFRYFRYLVEHEKMLFDGLTNPGDSDQNLLATMEELDTFYLFNKLHFLSSLINLEQNIAFAQDHPDAYDRMLKNKKLMLYLCQLISKTKII